MRKIKFLTTMLPVLACAAMFVATQPVQAQSSQTTPTAQQEQPMQPDNQNVQSAAAEKTFSGKIVKAGGKLILSAADATYQLTIKRKQKSSSTRA